MNVLIFEPYDLGNWFVKFPNNEKSFMVFYSMDRHFDSIFTDEYIEVAAYSQGKGRFN